MKDSKFTVEIILLHVLQPLPSTQKAFIIYCSIAINNIALDECTKEEKPQDNKFDELFTFENKKLDEAMENDGGEQPLGCNVWINLPTND